MLRFAGRSSGGVGRADTLDRPASSGAIADAAGQFRKIEGGPPVGGGGVDALFSRGWYLILPKGIGQGRTSALQERIERRVFLGKGFQAQMAVEGRERR
jgi:hypothetical protein